MNPRGCDRLWSPRHADDSGRSGLWRGLRSRGLRLFSDKSLVRRARARDIGAFDALAARYHDRLLELAMRPAGNDRDAAARRESVLVAFHDIDSFAAKCSPGTWLYLTGFRAVFAHMDAPAEPYPIADSDEPATVLPGRPRAA